MINVWFICAMIAGICLRILDGKIISVTAGLAAGVILVEVSKHVMWMLSK